MSLTATRTNNPVDATFLQDVGSSFVTNTRGYTTLQQLVGNGYLEFGFDQNSATAPSAAAGITFAIYPHATRNAMSALHLIAFGFCVRGNEDSNKIFVKALNTFIDTTVAYSTTVRMRVERIGTTVNFYTVVNNVATLRHTVSNTFLPSVSEFIILSGRNGCRVANVLISGVTQAPTPLDPTTNVYLPLEGGLGFSSVQNQLFVSMTAGEAFTWYFPDGTTSTEQAPNKVIDSQPFTQLIKLNVPSGVDKIRDLTFPALRRDGKFTPPDLSLLTSLRAFKLITRVASNSSSERRYLAFTSQFRLPNTIQDVIIEPLFDEDTLQPGTLAETRMSALLLPEAFNFSGFSQLRSLRLGFQQDNPRKYQAGFSAVGRFPNLSGCASLLSLVIDTYRFATEPGITENVHFPNPIPLANIQDCVNITSVTIHERAQSSYNEGFMNSLIVGIGRAIGSRTTPVLTVAARRGANLQTVTGTILSFAANAAVGANSIQLTSITGLSVGDRLHLEDGATNSLNNNLVIASIAGTASPFTVTFQTGQTLQNAYTTATGRVLNLESGLGSTRRLRLLGHTITVLPATI